MNFPCHKCALPASHRIPAFFALVMLVGWLAGSPCSAQIDPEHRSLLELGYDQPVTGLGPQGIYAYYYYNQPNFFNTNTALRMAFAPAYVDGELGFKQLLSPTTDVGFGFNGGAFGANYYEVRQGQYYQSESFYGNGGGANVSVYQLLNPGMLIPVNVVARAGFLDSAYLGTSDTADNFTLPGNQVMAFTRTGIRVAGKEPLLYPDLGMELSVRV
jgi:hypothetical protein